MIRFCPWLLLFFLLINVFETYSQSFSAKLYPDSLQQAKYFNTENRDFDSQESLTDHLKSTIDSLQQNGYLAASIDSTRLVKDNFEVFAYLGERYKISAIQNKGIDSTLFDQKFNAVSTLTWLDINRKKSEILSQYVDDGYIDAKIKIDDIQFDKNQISGTLHLNSGPQYVLDTIILSGDLTIRQSYLENNLNVKKGSILNKSFFTRLEQQISASNFMKLRESPSFELIEDGKAIIHLPLDEKAANEFDLLIGVIPNPNPLIAQQNLLLTGEGKLQLYNPFGTGKEFLIDYKQLQPESPRLESELYFPQFFKNEIGVIGSFELFKLDTSFINIDGKFGLRYDFSSSRNLSLSYRKASSFIQRIDTTYVKQNLSLPRAIDYDENIYQAEFEWVGTDYPRNPSKGFNIEALSAIGNREISRNETIVNLDNTNFDFASLYDGINDDKFLLNAQSKIQYFIPAFKRSTFLLQNNSGVHKVNRYFENDLFRLGGYSTIRGFDEQAYLASSYIINTAEYRFLLSRDSFFSVFGDWAFLKNQMLDQNRNNELLGIGTGLDLATQAGIFSLNFAIGQDNETTFDFNKTRMHIGYVNVF